MAKAKQVQAEQWTYVLRADRDLPTEEQSRWTLAPLRFRDKCRVRDELRVVETRDAGGGGQVVRLRTLQVARELVHAHLVKVENFPAGAPREWPAKGSTDDKDAYLDLLGEDGVEELGDAIFSRSTLGGAEGN